MTLRATLSARNSVIKEPVILSAVACPESAEGKNLVARI
jgi:hypothetical protein